MSQHVTKKQLNKEISQLTGISQADSNTIIDTFINLIYSHLKEGDSIKLQKLGTFSKVHYNKRSGFDIRKRKKIVIPAYDSVRFKVAPKLRKLFK